MKKEFSSEELKQLEQRYRANLINSIGGFKSLVLMGTKSKNGKTNLAVFNSVFHLGAHPPLFGFIIRPDSVERHTLSNIIETGVFTVNHVREDFFERAHQTSARYPKDVSEFEASGLTEEYRNSFAAPFVKESQIQIAASLVQKTDIAENGTILIVARIEQISLPENCLLPDGFADLEKAGTITCSGLDSYHRTQKIARLSYAKPDRVPEQI